MHSHSNTLACQFKTRSHTHTHEDTRTHTDQTLSNTQTHTLTRTLFKPSPGISCHTTCLGELSRDRHCQLRVPQMPTSSQAEEKSSLSPSIICANPSWEIVKSTAYLPNSISHRQVLISYLDPFPSRTDDKSSSTKCDYLLFSFFLHFCMSWLLMVGDFKTTRSKNFEVLFLAEEDESHFQATTGDRSTDGKKRE